MTAIQQGQGKTRSPTLGEFNYEPMNYSFVLVGFIFWIVIFYYIPCRESGNRKSLNSSIVGKTKNSPVDAKVLSPGRLVYELAPDALEFRKKYQELKTSFSHLLDKYILIV